MSAMMDNGQPASNYCYTHRLFYDGQMCPDCILEEWDEFHREYVGHGPGMFKETNPSAKELFATDE